MKIWHTILGRSRRLLRSPKRGSVLLLTLFIVTGLCLMIGVLLKATVNETKMNQRAMLTLEAKNAVEAATEIIISQIKLRFDNYPYISGNYFITNPQTINSTISSWLWNGTNVSASNVTVKVSTVPAPTLIYIDPTNPGNNYDPDRGKNVTASDVYVYATATARNAWGSETAYGTQALEVRNSPLFTNAIFYNMALEVYPGPAMTISGPVHTNGDLWVAAGTNLTFTNPITSTGNFNVGFMSDPTSWSGNQSGSDGTKVHLPNSSGGTTTPYKGTGNSYLSSSYWDSRQTNFNGTSYTSWAQVSANLWGGNLQTSANGVPYEQVSSYNSFVYKVGGTSQDLNYAYAIIEPLQPSNYSNGTANPYHKGVGETQKFERNSNFIVKVLATGTANITTTQVITGNSANATLVNAAIAANELAINTTVAGMYTTGNIVTSAVATSTNSTTANMTLGGNIMLSNGTVANITGNMVNPAITSGNTKAFSLVTQLQSKTSGNDTLGGTAALSGTPNVGNSSTTTLMETTVKNAVGNTTVVKTTRFVGVAYVELNTLKTAINATTNALTPVYDASTQQTDAGGDITYPGDVTMLPLQVNSTMITGTYNATTGAITNGALQDALQFRPAIGNMTKNTTTSETSYTGNLTDLWNGLYDGRRGQLISTVNMNVGKLKLILDNNTTGFSTNASAFFNGTGDSDFDPTAQYNGVVYVEFPTLPGNATRLNSVTSGNTTYPGDAVLTSTDYTGLVVVGGSSSGNVGGTATGVPNPDYSTTSTGTVGRAAGFTLATNNCLYVTGSFNADGNLSTPKADTSGNATYNATMPDNVAHPDPVTCLAADSVTMLSSAWLNRKSHTQGTATGTEVNAAILTGIVPSLKSASTALSGGVHNYPRFLEDWGSVVFRYRGSMVCLFESEIGKQPWSTAYYGAPNRQWGFYDQFSQGHYPPGTPSARDYVRVNFSYLTKAQYDAATSGL